MFYVSVQISFLCSNLLRKGENRITSTNLHSVFIQKRWVIEPSKIKGVKIVIKGRLNGVPRAKQKMMIIGDVPAQSISANLDYAQTTIHNSNGSYGVQVWIVEK